MPIPDLVNGLLPSGIHDCTLAEVERRFGSASNRRGATYRAIEAIAPALLRCSGVIAVYVDGSYVTDKNDPDDADLLVETRCLPRHLTTAETQAVEAALGPLAEPAYAPLLHVHLYHPGLRFEGCPGRDKLDTFTLVRPEEADQRGLPRDSRRGILRLKR